MSIRRRSACWSSRTVTCAISGPSRPAAMRRQPQTASTLRSDWSATGSPTPITTRRCHIQSSSTMATRSTAATRSINWGDQHRMAAYGCIPIMPHCCSTWCNRKVRTRRPSKCRTKHALTSRHCRGVRSRRNEAWTRPRCTRPRRGSYVIGKPVRCLSYPRNSAAIGRLPHALTSRHCRGVRSRRNEACTRPRCTRPCRGSCVIGNPVRCLSYPRHSAAIGHLRRGMPCRRGRRRRLARRRRRSAVVW